MQEDTNNPENSSQDLDAQAPQQPISETTPPSEDDQNKAVTGSAGRFKNFNKKFVLLAVVILCGIGGSIYLLVSHAETPTPPPAVEDKPTYSVALPNPPYAPDAVMLKFNAGVPQAVQDKLIARYGNVKKDLPQIGVKEITVPEEALDAVINALSHNPAVAFAEKDWATRVLDTTPNDPEWPAEFGPVVTQTNKAWDSSTGTASTIIADLDTGVAFTHPDLQGKTLSTGYDFVNNDADPTDDNWHGTATASVAAATTNNAIGMAAYCWGCMILPVKVMDANGGGYLSTAAQGIDYAADHGAKIVNMSFASTGTASYLDNAITYARNKGLSLYGAAGNSGSSSPIYPAASKGVIGVAGTQFNDTLYSWSDYGSWVKIAVAGCGIVATNTSYGNGCGTSFATPAVAGIAGLLWSAKPTATAAQVEQALLNNTDPCCGGQISNGRANAYKAMQAILGTTPPADTTAPTASITAPAGGTTVSGQVSVNVSAADNVGVAKVELYKNGALYATSTAAPYNFFWDTTVAANGSYSLTAKAYDAAGNVGSSAAVAVTVSNTVTTRDTVLPVATFTSPSNGATVSGSKVAISANATDNVGVVEMDIYIDGVLKTTSTSGSVSTTWNTNGKVKSGSHTITVKAYDAAGNVGTSSITVTK